MDYIFDYCIVSFAFLLIIAIYYFGQKKIDTPTFRLYGVLLAVGLCSLVLDIVAAVTNYYAESYPAWILYVINILFLGCVQTSGPLFVLYVIGLTGEYGKVSLWKWVLIHTPFLIAIFYLLISPFGRYGAFYLDENNKYITGASHTVLYVAVAFYVVLSFIIVILRRKHIQKRKRITIYGFLTTLVVAMYVQMSFPEVLINTTANALALTMMYHALQRPSDNIDPETNSFNYSALPIIINDRTEQGKPFSVLVFPLTSFRLLSHLYSAKYSDEVLRELSLYFEKQFNKSPVIHISADTFAVVLNPEYPALTAEMVTKAAKELPTSFRIDNLDIAFSSSVIGINSTDFKSAEDIIGIINYISRVHDRTDGHTRHLLVGEKMKKEFTLYHQTEEALEYAIRNHTIDVCYQPIHDFNGKLVALEALCRINDEKLGPLRPDMFIPMAEKNGSIFKLTEQVLEKVCDFINGNDVTSWNLEHIGVNLSILQFSHEQFGESIMKIIRENNIKPGLLRFELTETESAASLPRVRENMQALISNGFTFLLDDFGSGYANFNYLSELPFYCVKLDKSLLWNCNKELNSMNSLVVCNEIVKRLGLPTICEGVETEEQINLLKSIGVDMIQGFYYSKSLTPDELLAYIDKEAHAV